ncbi:SDR family oxidoreductase [Prevotella sp. 10(H)]|uniref:SDR family oxidoreductase n=1 Tax=Prevotella sp. 10(H) TaxID=1158294 RepID=UPI0004A6CF3C|nr:SDR family oxidoreductase [Prevotella sp. 10(H)]
MSNLNGKVAIVTGGGGVLGGNISKSLVEAGVRVIILDVRQENIDKRIDELKSLGEISGFICNVLDIDSLNGVKDKIVEKWGKIDMLINAAGGNLPGATLAEDQDVFDMKVSDLNRVIDLNMYGSVYPCLVFGKVMADQKYGSIVNVSSMATYSAITRVPGYSMAKTAINIFTQWMAMEMALKFSDKIRVNAIAPGFFIGDQNRGVLINPDGSYTNRSIKVLGRTPMKRFGDISELNGIVKFLCSDEAGFITGAVIPVDGGFSSFSGV